MLVPLPGLQRITAVRKGTSGVDVDESRMGSRVMVANSRENSHVLVMMALMAQQDGRTDRTAVVYLSALGGLVGSLCCVTPVVLVLLALASVSVANDWGNLLYGDYKWWF